MKILAFSASNSTNSINKKLVTYAAQLMDKASVEVLDLNAFELPIFSPEREKQLGKPQLAKDFIGKIQGADAVLISFAEHNGCYSAAYKNLFDWCSRVTPKVYEDKPMVLMATSPGGRGGATVLNLAASAIPHFGGRVKATFSLPNFSQNFDTEQGEIVDVELQQQLDLALQKLF